MEFNSEYRDKGPVSVLSVDLTSRGRFEDLQMIQCDSAVRKLRNSQKRRRQGSAEEWERVPALSPIPCSSYRTAASDDSVHVASSYRWTLDMERAEIMTMS